MKICRPEVVLKFSKEFESCKLVAYKDAVGVPTIGYGTTYYPDLKPVKLGHTCTQAQADMWHVWNMETAEAKVLGWLKNAKALKANQIEALTLFVNNAGYGKSLFELVNKNPNAKELWGTFLLYVKGDGTHNKKDDDGDGLIDEPGEMQTLRGLVRRRNSEAHLYFLNELNFYKDLIK